MTKQILLISIILGVSLSVVGCNENSEKKASLSQPLLKGKSDQSNYEMAQKFFNEGDYKQALAYDMKQLQVDLKYYKEQSAEISLDYNNIGLDYDELEAYNKAVEYYSKAMEIDNIVLDKNSTERATTYYNIASSYDALGENNNSLTYYFKALEIDKMVSGEYHEDVLSSYLDIAKLYDKTEKYTSALTYYKKALKVQEKLYEKDDPDTKVTQRIIEELEKKVK